MKKLFAVLVILVMFFGFGCARAKPVPQPDMPKDAKLVDEFEENLSCGKKISTLLVDDVGVQWGWHKIVNSVALIKLNPDNSVELWADRDGDGDFEEHYTGLDEFHNKYPTPCDVIKK